MTKGTKREAYVIVHSCLDGLVAIGHAKWNVLAIGTSRCRPPDWSFIGSSYISLRDLAIGDHEAEGKFMERA
jgi:hypothetical protein